MVFCLENCPKLLKGIIRGQRLRICKNFEITRTIYWKFLVSFDTLNRFFHIPAFMDYFQYFENLNSISVPSINRLYQLHEILVKPYLVPKLTVDRATFEPTTLDTKQT